MIDVIWSAPVSDPSGYGCVTRKYLSELYNYQNKELNIRILPKNFFNGDKVDLSVGYSQIKEMFLSNADSYNCFIQNLTPNTFTYKPSVPYHIAMTTFETNGLPNNWIMPLQAMDEIFVYTQFNVNTFRNAGITRPITVIPHGVDSNMFSPECGEFVELKNVLGDVFVFGSNFDWTDRKNPELLLRAFWKAFDGHNDVVLLLKSFFQHPITQSRKFILSNIERMRRSTKISGEHSPVYLLSNVLPDNIMPKFYNTLDAYVGCSSGEGWGLTFSEAMSSSLPTIATGWSGNTEFMNRDNSFLLDYEIKLVPQSFSRFHQQYTGQSWAEPNEDDLIDKMRYVYNNRDIAKKIGARARSDMIKKWSWKNAVDKIKNRLVEIFGEE